MTLRLTKQTLLIAGRQMTVELPASQDELLEEAIREENSGLSNGDPYWGSLWETAPRTAAMILQHAWPSHLQVLELGCGIGVVGIAGLMAGHAVTFSDHASAAVKLAMSNAALNGFTDAAGVVFDWHQPPTTDQYDLIVASDILYETSSHKPLLDTIQVMLAEHGMVCIGESGRANAENFLEIAEKHGWVIETFNESSQPFQQPQHLQFRMYVLRQMPRRA